MVDRYTGAYTALLASLTLGDLKRPSVQGPRHKR